MNRATLRRHGPLVAIMLGQVALAAVVGSHARGSWPYSDAHTYFAQAVMLWQGLFPPDPARPVFYPYFLSLGMSIFGLSPWGLWAWQALPFLATTGLVYRLGLVISGRRAAIIAAAAFAFFPASILYGGLYFYREGLTAFLLIAVLNLLEFMLRDTGRRARAFYAGLAAGCLTLIKPEFGSLLAVLGLFDLAAAWRAGALRPRLAAWAVCATVAIGATLPAVAADRLVFKEWIFINTYKGYNYYLSYCGETPLCKGSFMDCDYGRYQDAHPVAIQQMFLAPASVPFVERDRRLAVLARQCIVDDPAGAAWKYVSRARDALFGFLDPTGELRSGFYGPWRHWTIAGFFLLGFAPQIAALFLLPASAPLWRGGFAGRAVLLTVAWYVVFYASVVYLNRFKVAVWPVLALAAAAGLVNLRELKIRERWVWVWVVAVLLLGRWDGLSHPLAAITDGQLEVGRHPGLSEKDRTNNLIELSAIFLDAGNPAGLDEVMGPYIRERRTGLGHDPSVLKNAAKWFVDHGAPAGADFFNRMADELYPAPPAAPTPPVSP